MNVVGKVGSLISQGVYSVATPFHPFGGAVDVIAVEQPDGTYRSTPWYVRFGKFQGVLKGAEKFVRISVNGVEAGFHMYLDNSGEAYFVREIVPSSKDSEKDEFVKKAENLEDTRQDNSSIIDNDISNSGNDSFDESNSTEVQFSDEHTSFSTTQIENDEPGNERLIYDYHDHQSPDSLGSSEYQNFCYGSLDQLEDVVESQNSDSEVVIISVDGHVLTAPISTSEQNLDNVQLSTPQFHLGPGEGAEFSASNEEFSTDQDTWASDYLSDIDVTGSNNSSSKGIITKLDNGTVSGHLLEVHDVVVELAKEALETQNMEIIKTDSVKCDSPEHVSDTMHRREIFKSFLELQELSEHSMNEELQDMDSPSVEMEVKGNDEDSMKNNLSDPPMMEEMEVQNDTNFQSNSSAECSIPKRDSTCNELPVLSVEVHASKSNTLTTDKTDVIVSDGISDHSIDKEHEMKDEQFSLAPEASVIQNSPDPESSKSEVVEPQEGSFDEGVKTGAGMGFEISLCRNLLHAGLGLGLAAETFDAHRISMEKFKASASSITKDENLVIRFKGRYLSWEKAAPIVLGIAAFGLDLSIESKNAIAVEHDEPVTSRENSPRLTSTPSGRRWRLWPIPFRRVKTLQHTTSNVSSEDIFVDSESCSLNPQADITPTSRDGNESPQMQLIRTNVPTTEQIASLNLKDGQNMITFSFSTRVLGTQQVDAHIYLWKWNARIVISDVDGTITRSDVLGQFMPLVGKDWTQSGVARLFSAIKENGYHLLFLSARAIVQAYLTRSFLLNLKQDGKALPSGPVVISPDGLFPSLYREVIRRAPHEFKIACLEDIKALFPSDYNPFYAGFGNRDTDELSYRKIGIPKGKIFIINPKGEVAISHRIDVKSYTSLHTLVNDMFPPTTLVEQEDYNSWNYWRVPLPTVD